MPASSFIVSVSWNVADPGTATFLTFWNEYSSLKETPVTIALFLSKMAHAQDIHLADGLAGIRSTA